MVGASIVETAKASFLAGFKQSRREGNQLDIHNSSWMAKPAEFSARLEGCSGDLHRRRTSTYLKHKAVR